MQVKQYYEIIEAKKVFYEDLTRTIAIFKEEGIRDIEISFGNGELKTLNEVFEINSKELHHISIKTKEPCITIMIFPKEIIIYSQSNSEVERKIFERISRFYRSLKSDSFIYIFLFISWGIASTLMYWFAWEYIKIPNDFINISIDIGIITLLTSCILFSITKLFQYYLYNIKELKIYLKSEQTFYEKYKDIILLVISNIFTALTTFLFTK